MGETARVVIVGAGFGGLNLAQALKNARFEVVLIDVRNYHTFQPLLYQVGTAALEPDEIAYAVRGLFQKQANFHFRLGLVNGVDWQRQEVLIQDEDPVHFDYLVLAAGAVNNDFGIEGVERYGFPLKTLEEAIALRSHVMRQFELASTDPSLIEQGALNFVVVGGGPTGVEMAGALREWFGSVLVKDFPRLETSKARVILLEATDKLLAPFAAPLRQEAVQTLRARGVDVRFSDSVIQVTAEAVYLKTGEIIPTKTVFWSAGVKANPLGKALAVELGRGGRVVVNPDLSLPSHPNVFVIGDMAAGKNPDGSLHPQLAQVAIQGAKHVARQLSRDQQSRPRSRFVYKDPGIMATIGRNSAVAQLNNGLRFTGFIAWLMWLFLHLLYLIGFRNRLLVLINWAWNYFTYDRSSRLILKIEPERAGESVRVP